MGECYLGKTSVIIAVRNDPTGLRATLSALRAQTLGPLGVGDHRRGRRIPDDTAQVAEAADGVELIRLASSLGAYGARNAGIQQSTGEFLGLLSIWG